MNLRKDDSEIAKVVKQSSMLYGSFRWLPFVQQHLVAVVSLAGEDTAVELRASLLCRLGCLDQVILVFTGPRNAVDQRINIGFLAVTVLDLVLRTATFLDVIVDTALRTVGHVEAVGNGNAGGSSQDGEE